MNKKGSTRQPSKSDCLKESSILHLMNEQTNSMRLENLCKMYSIDVRLDLYGEINIMGVHDGT